MIRKSVFMFAAALPIVGCALPPGPAAMDVAEGPDGGAAAELSTVTPTDLQSEGVSTDEPPSTEMPVADAMSNEGPTVFTAADPLPLSDLEGWIVWVEPWEDERGRSGDVHSLDLNSGTHELLWADTLDVRIWAVAPETGMAAYRTMRDDREVLVARALMPNADANVVARTVMSGTNIAAPSWDLRGRTIAYSVHVGAWTSESRDGLCEYRIVDVSSATDDLVWSGRLGDFPYAWDCADVAHVPDLKRVAVFENPHESTLSAQLSIVDSAIGQGIERYEIKSESRSRAQSIDGTRIALLDSASYYGSRYPFANRIFASPDRWPGSASVRIFDIESGELREIAAWNTDIGFTHPIWSRDSMWFAFAEPVGSFPTATPYPTVPSSYPPPEAQSVPPDYGSFSPSATTIWVLSGEGAVIAQFDFPRFDTWPVAASPSGEHLLIATYTLEEGSIDLSIFRISDGVGGLLATVPISAAAFSWIR